MKYYQLTIFFLFINVFTGLAQNRTTKPVAGTRLILTLPKEFKEDRSLPGFRSEIDSSIIYVVEIDNPYSFDELIQKRISNTLAQGIDTSHFKTSTYDGYKAVQFETYIPELHKTGFTINFGSDDFLVDISIETSSERLKELKKIILSGKYNKNLKVDSEDLLGFIASFEKTNLKVFKKDANTLNLREKDENGNVLSWLNLTHMPKSSFGGLSAQQAILATYRLYNFDKNYVESDSLIIDNSRFVYNLYMQDHTTSQEYTLIGIIQKREFDLLVMGGVSNKEKIDAIYNIIKSIKFKRR